MKKTVLFSTLAFFASVGAQALSWTGSQDLSSVNAQIIDTGTTDYELSAIDTLNPITDQILINGASMGLLSSFTFDSGDDLNPYVMTDAVSAGGVLQFNSVEATNIVVDADITNTYSAGYGVYALNSTIGTLNLSGTMNAGRYGVYLSGTTVNSLVSTADITSTNMSGMLLHTTTVTNGIDIGGTIVSNSSGDSGVYLYNATADYFTSTADITARSTGIRLDNVDIAGAITIGGTFTTEYAYAQITIGQGDSTAGSIVINSGYFNSSANATMTVSGAVDINSSNGAYLTNLTADSLSFSSNINSDHNGIWLQDVTLTNNLDLSGVTTITTANTGLNIDNVTSANEIDLSTIQSITGGTRGLDISDMTLSSFTSAIDITASQYGILLNSLDIAGALNLSGTIDAGYYGINLSNTTADSLVVAADVSATNYAGVYLNNATITNGMDISGTINAGREGINLYTVTADSFTSTADITSTWAGISLRSTAISTSTISGTINASLNGLYLWSSTADSIVSTADITSDTEYGVYLYSGSTMDAFVNNGSITSTTKAAIAGDTGSNTLNYSGTGTLSGATYKIDMQGGTDTVNISNATINDLSVNSAENINVAADASIGGTGLVVSGVTTATSIINDGSVSEITMDGANSVLTYSGTGTLSGATYDIDMGAGADVLTISGVTMDAPRINGTERVNISNSVLQLDLTDANKASALMTLDGTNLLDLFNVTFDINSTATLADGDQLVLASVAGVDATNLNTLMVNLAGFDGAFSIVDNAGTDELTFTLGDVVIPPVAPPSAATALSDTFVSSGAVAMQVSNASDNVIKGRMDKLFQGKRQEFASLYSDSMYQIHEEPRSQLWAQGFGLSGAYEGDIAKGLNGYDTSLAGVVIGYDYNWGAARTGFALTHTTGEIEGDQEVFNIDVESFGGSLYSVFDFDNMYIETAASFGTTTFDQNLGGTLSSYDSTDMGGLMRVGLKLHVGHFGLEQYVGFQYKNVIVEEHDNGVDTVAEYNQEMFKAELGFVTSYQMLLASGDAIVPYLRLETGRDFADNATLTSLDNSGAAVGSLETVDLGDWVSRIATGVSFLTREGYSISGEYEYEFRDKYQAHIGKIKGRLMF